MSCPARSCTLCPRLSPVLLLLGLLLLRAVATLASADPKEEDHEELHCLCVKTTSRVHLKHIVRLEVIKAGFHCPTIQMIHTEEWEENMPGLEGPSA